MNSYDSLDQSWQAELRKQEEDAAHRKLEMEAVCKDLSLYGFVHG